MEPRLDWQIRVFRQQYWPPFKPWTAIATIEANGTIWGFNVDADTESEAEDKILAKILDEERRFLRF
jgi:hypothetical protein